MLHHMCPALLAFACRACTADRTPLTLKAIRYSRYILCCDMLIPHR